MSIYPFHMIYMPCEKFALNVVFPQHEKYFVKIIKSYWIYLIFINSIFFRLITYSSAQIIPSGQHKTKVHSKLEVRWVWMTISVSIISNVASSLHTAPSFKWLWATTVIKSNTHLVAVAWYMFDIWSFIICIIFLKCLGHQEYWFLWCLFVSFQTLVLHGNSASSTAQYITA